MCGEGGGFGFLAGGVVKGTGRGGGRRSRAIARPAPSVSRSLPHPIVAACFVLNPSFPLSLSLSSLYIQNKHTGSPRGPAPSALAALPPRRRPQSASAPSPPPRAPPGAPAPPPPRTSTAPSPATTASTPSTSVRIGVNLLCIIRAPPYRANRCRDRIGWVCFPFFPFFGCAAA